MIFFSFPSILVIGMSSEISMGQFVNESSLETRAMEISVSGTPSLQARLVAKLKEVVPGLRLMILIAIVEI